MIDKKDNCLLCRGTAGDEELQRIQVWEDEYWRLTMSLAAEVKGFSYLEPKRHIPSITDLDGEEARRLGSVLARTTRVLRDETGADQVYLYVFGGGLPHLHMHLAPHTPGDALSEQVIKGEVVAEKLESGAERLASKEFPPLPEGELRATARRVRHRLGGLVED